jgi:hypothetical protein
MDLKNLETVLRRQPFLAALVLNILFFAVHYVSAEIYYFSEKEAEWVSRILSPEWRTPNANSFFNNLLVWLYGSYPGYAWYKFVLLGTMLASHIGLSYGFFSVKPKAQTIFLSTASFFLLSYCINGSINAETAAGFSGLSGILLIVLSDKNDERASVARQIFGAILSLWSGFLSWAAFGLIMMLVLPFWLLTLQREQQIRALITGGLLAVVVMLSLLADWYHYTTSTHNPDLLREQVLTSLRRKIALTVMPQEELTENLERSGISYNDYEMLKREFVLGEKTVNIRSMSAFLARQSFASERDTIFAYFQSLGKENYVRKVSGLALIFTAFSLFFVAWDRFKIRTVLFSALAAVSWLLMFYAYSYSNLDSSYLASGIYYLAILPFLIFITTGDTGEISKNRNTFIFAAIMLIFGALLVASVNPHTKSFDSQYCETKRCDWKEFSEYASEHGNNLFVIWGNHRLNECFSTDLPLDFLNMRNVLWLKGDQQSKRTTERLDVFFIKDLPADFLKREHAYLVLPNYELEDLKKLLITYFSEKHHQPVKMERVKIFKNFVVVRLVNYQ